MPGSTEKTTMEIIREGLLKTHKPGEQDTSFSDAIYELFKEFCEDYKKEWERIDDNEDIYVGDHWKGVNDLFADSNPNVPKPVTPIITSTIENLKADLSDEFPEAIILPDSAGTEVAAKVLTKAISEELDVCGFADDYNKMTQDMLNDGWTPFEVGYDNDANNGFGGAYIRYCINKNWMCDPQCIDLQQGRAVFKMDRRPYDWFKQHYPQHEPYMSGDSDLVEETHDHFGSTTEPSNKHSYRLIEAWFRIYDPKTRKYTIHFVKLAGGQILENSHDSRPNGYYAHGMYPFVICRLFPQKGNALGLGITDLFKGAQRFSDKLDQIMLVNAFRASRNRLLIQNDSVNYDDARDFSKEVLPVSGSPDSCVKWMEQKPLPAYMLTYISSIREGIKAESGSNEQSRGNTSSGVTAASAITALQDMSTKRSRMEAQAVHCAFRKAVRMMIDVLREFSIVPRDIVITIQGQEQTVPFDKDGIAKLFDSNRALPVEHFINIRSARQTKYSKLEHNELWLEMMKALSGTVDPAIMIEGLEYDEKERLLDNIRKAQNSGMLALQNQIRELSAAYTALEAERNEYRNAVIQSQSGMQSQAEMANQRRELTSEESPAPEINGDALNASVMS